MRKRLNTATVSLSQGLGMGRRDAIQSERDNYRDTSRKGMSKRPFFKELQRDNEWDRGGTVPSEGCLIVFRSMG
jgi:hypothetical protein